MFLPLLIPFCCWLLGLLATRDMNRTRKNWLSGASLFCTVLLMIALLLFRAFVQTGFRVPEHVTLAAVMIALLCGVGIFLRAWSLYDRDRLAAEEIAPYCVSGFLIELGALGAFCVVCLCTPVTR